MVNTQLNGLLENRTGEMTDRAESNSQSDDYRGRAVSLSPFISLVSSIPFAALASIFIISAVIFNIGYFTVVGMPFITLFSLQESIVFTFVGFIMFSLIPASMFPLFFLVKRRISKGYVGVFLPFAFTASVSLIIVLIVYIFTGFNVLRESVISFFIVFISLSSSYSLHKYNNSNRRIVDLSIVSLSLLSFFFMCGYQYASVMIDSHINSRIETIGYYKNQRLNIIRFGSSYILLIDNDGIIHAARSEEVADIQRVPKQKAPKLSPGAL